MRLAVVTSISEEVWLENEMFQKQRRLLEFFVFVMTIFTFTLCLYAFAMTGDSVALLILTLGVSATIAGYTGLFYIPRFVRVSNDSIQLRYYGP